MGDLPHPSPTSKWDSAAGNQRPGIRIEADYLSKPSKSKPTADLYNLSHNQNLVLKWDPNPCKEIPQAAVRNFWLGRLLNLHLRFEDAHRLVAPGTAARNATPRRWQQRCKPGGANGSVWFPIKPFQKRNHEEKTQPDHFEGAVR